MSVQDTRLEMLRRAIDYYCIDEDPENGSGVDVSFAFGRAEDPDDNVEQCPRFLAVTARDDDTRYGYLCEVLTAAMVKAVENCGDTIAAEWPVAIVDLDTGRQTIPSWDDLPWRPVGSLKVTA